MTIHDPPSDERNKAGVWKWARGVCRRLVHKRTIKGAIMILIIVDRLVRLFEKLNR
jgi:hypothetical protein